MQRYARLYVAFAKNSFLNALEYRLSFIIWSIATICYAIVYVASIQFIFAHVQTIGGWRLEQMLVLAATVMIVDGIVESIFGENMNALSGLINRGELDFVLSKPVNTRFYVSTRKFDWDPLVQVVIGCGLLWYAIGLLAQPIAWHGVLLYLALVVCACLIAYSLWFMIISATFFAGRLNNVGHLYSNLIETARVPTDVFRGVLRIGADVCAAGGVHRHGPQPSPDGPAQPRLRPRRLRHDRRPPHPLPPLLAPGTDQILQRE